jgi:hypothetical protein
MLTFGLLVVFIYIFKSAEWIIISNLISVSIMVLIVGFSLFVKKGYRISFTKGLFKDMLKYGLKAQMGNGIQIII